MKHLFLAFTIAATLIASTLTQTANAESKLLHNNLSYHPLSQGLKILNEATSASGAAERDAPLMPLSFHYAVKSPRDAATGMASGKRTHGAIQSSSYDLPMLGHLKEALLTGDVDDIIKHLKHRLVELAHLKKPVDVNAEISLVFKKLISDIDPELSQRFDELADAVGKVEANRTKITSLNARLGDCEPPQSQQELQLREARCSQEFVQELNEKLSSAQDQMSSLQELTESTALRLQQAMERRSKAIEQLSNMLKKMDETADAIVNNLK